VVITAAVLPGGEAGGRLVNSASVSSTSLDPTGSNNASTSGSDVDERAELTIQKVIQPSTTVSGGVAAVGILVANAGPSTAKGVTVLDSYDGNASAALDPNGPPCSILSNGQLECTLPDIAPGDSQLVQFAIISFDEPGSFVNTAVAATTTPESDTGNNTATAPLTVTAPMLDLQLTKTGPPNILAGGRFTYTLTLRNTGPSIAFQAAVVDTLPAGLVPDGATSSSGTCIIVAQTVTCTPAFVLPASLFPGAPPDSQDVTITVTGTVDPDIAGANVANATAPGETNPPDNTSGVTTPIIRQADVSVVKTSETATFAAGGAVVYDIAVSKPVRRMRRTPCSPTCFRRASRSTPRCRTRRRARMWAEP
jgi:uncharacterized repeat protein (TIGR01451 family)